VGGENAYYQWVGKSFSGGGRREKSCLYGRGGKRKKTQARRHHIAIGVGVVSRRKAPTSRAKAQQSQKKGNAVRQRIYIPRKKTSKEPLGQKETDRGKQKLRKRRQGTRKVGNGRGNKKGVIPKGIRIKKNDLGEKCRIWTPKIQSLA